MRREQVPSSVVVLGAGMVGTCTALHLQQRGIEVVLIDRRPPGQETSYGNAGLIQREAVEPYAFPREWRILAAMLLGQRADVHLHWRALPALMGPLWRYFRLSAPGRLAEQARAYSRLIEHCLDEHRRFLDAAQAHALIHRTGYRDAFREARSFDAAVRDAARLQQTYGLRYEVLDGTALSRAEPALQRRLPGAIHWLDPWSVQDPGDLVQAYADLFARRGGQIVQAALNRLEPQGSGWRVQTAAGVFEAPAVVLALGPWAARWIEPLGYRLPLYVKRGYHQHYAGGDRLNVPILDAYRGYVLVPMRRGMRITTGAEFARQDAPATPAQLERAHRSASELIRLSAPQDDPPWLGARPCTADMLPVMGPAPRHRGLWFNFGHSHQGFTLGPAAGRMLAELITGERPLVEPHPYRPERFEAG